MDKSCPGRRNRGSVPAPLLLIILLLCLLIDPETNVGHGPLHKCGGQGHPTKRARTRSSYLRKNTTRHRAPNASPTVNKTESIRHTPGLPRWPRPAAPPRPRKRRRRHDAAAAGRSRRPRPPPGRSLISPATTATTKTTPPRRRGGSIAGRRGDADRIVVRDKASIRAG